MLFDVHRLFVLLPSLAILFLAGLLDVCWVFQRQQRFLLWLAGAYSLLAVTLAMQTLIEPASAHKFSVFIGSSYLLSSWLFSESFAARRQVPSHRPIALTIGLLTLSGMYYYSFIDRNVWGRIYWLGIGAGLIQLLPVPAVIKLERLKIDWLTRSLLLCYVVYAALTIARPVVVSSLGYTDLKNYIDSFYWLVVLSSILFFTLLFTLLMFACTFRDIVAQLRKERDQDSLTEILNRRAFYEASKLCLSDPQQLPAALLIGDIDHFKRINDTWGHDEGDKVLQAISSTFQHNIRSTDLVARFGGEEFVVLLTQTDLKSAKLVAERIRQEISADGYALVSGQSLTMSFGITSLTSYHTLHQALKEADKLLYDAKKSGRNRVHVDSDEAPSPYEPVQS